MAMTLVSTVTVGSGGAAEIQFTGIAGTGKDLLVLLSTRVSDSIGNVQLYLNNDTAFSSYVQINLNGTGSAVSSTNSGGGYWPNWSVNNSTQTANTFGNQSIYIANYALSSAKSISIDNVTENNATAARQELIASRWTGTSAVTSVRIANDVGTFVQNSTASLYIIS